MISETDVKNCDVSIIIACYNEEKILMKNVGIIHKVMSQTKYSYELIFVDDGSSDKTRELILELVSANRSWRYIFHHKNFGRGKSVIDGIRVAKGKYVGFLDIDLEIDAKYIPALLNILNKNYDVATIYRMYNLTFNFNNIARIVISILYRMIVGFVLRLPLKDSATGYKFFLYKKIKPIIDETENQSWFWDTEIMAISYLRGLRIYEMPGLFYRKAGVESKVQIMRDSIKIVIDLFQFKFRMYRGSNRGFIYFNPLIYSLFMRIIYQRNFQKRYQAIAGYVEKESTVVEVCCGDCYLFENYLKMKNIRYLGLDINPSFVIYARQRGIEIKLFDLNKDPLPKAQYIIMQASLYQFIPQHEKVLKKLLSAATKMVIIAEPIKNISNIRFPIISPIIKGFIKLGTNSTGSRFDKIHFQRILYKYKKNLKIQFKLEGREMIGVIKKMQA